MRRAPAPAAERLGRLAPNGKSKLVAALFALSSSAGLGIHKFYLGQTGWGILYLIFFWTVIPAVVGFIEGIMLLAMTQEEFNEKYGRV
jgi:TM2 domain-containing membrane protein YozV